MDTDARVVAIKHGAGGSARYDVHLKSSGRALMPSSTRACLHSSKLAIEQSAGHLRELQESLARTSDAIGRATALLPPKGRTISESALGYAVQMASIERVVQVLQDAGYTCALHGSVALH